VKTRGLLDFAWATGMRAVAHGVALRFFALRVWTLALVAPLLAAAAAGVATGLDQGRGPGLERFSLVLLGFLNHLLPPLAALFLLAPSDREGLDLLFARPLGWTGLVLGRLLGSAALFGGCHLALAAALWAALAVGEVGPPGLIYREASNRVLHARGGEDRSADEVSRPWPESSPDLRWLQTVEGARGYTFIFRGLAPGREHRARIWALGAQVVTHAESGALPPGPPPSAPPHRELARSNAVTVEISYRDPGGGNAAGGERLVLRDEGPTEFTVPAGATGAGGTLEVRVAPAAAPVEGVPDMTVGPTFFWFDPGGGGDPVLWRDLRLVVGEVPFAANAFRASLEALGKLFLVAALAVSSTALFSSGIAFAVVLTFYCFSSAAPFLREVVETLSRQSALLLLDPVSHHVPSSPTGFERGLKVFLESATAVLPDFSRFHGQRRLFSGEAILLAEIARTACYAAAYALAMLGLTVALRGRRYLRR
jgi:hypothetical protein